MGPRLAAAPAALLIVLALAFPAGAGASPRQISILQDDAVLLGLTSHDAAAAMAEAKSLGVDVVRVFLPWNRVSPRPRSRRRPARFDPGDPDSRGYDWGMYDGFVDRARAEGLDVMLTLSPPIPYWASEEPERCPHFTGGYRNLGKSCHWKPDPALFGQFAKAVAQRYGRDADGPHGGQVTLYSLYNEPNLEHYLYPQSKRTRHGVVDVAARRYRELWYEGWRQIARHDPALRGRVLFGETAAISSPLDTLNAALCLDEDGQPFRGALRRLQGCSRPRRLPIGGFAVHPYNKDASGTVFQRAGSPDSLPMAHMPRLHRLIDNAARHGRIPPGREIYITEFGFQSNPPDRRWGLGLDEHAMAINQAERLFFGDRRVRAIAQFELFDVPEVLGEDVYNTGLRERDGTAKPALRAFQMPLVVTRRSRDVVELWGAVRPAAGRASPRVMASARASGVRSAVARPATNSSGYFNVRLRRSNAARLSYQLEWRSPAGPLLRSRVASAGRRIAYRRR